VVKVSNIAVTSVKLGKKKLTLTVGGQQQLVQRLTPATAYGYGPSSGRAAIPPSRR
jgi:uncharacterized protein YjdB